MWKNCRYCNCGSQGKCSRRQQAAGGKRGTAEEKTRRTGEQGIAGCRAGKDSVASEPPTLLSTTTTTAATAATAAWANVLPLSLTLPLAPSLSPSSSPCLCTVAACNRNRNRRFMDLFWPLCSHWPRWGNCQAEEEAGEGAEGEGKEGQEAEGARHVESILHNIFRAQQKPNNCVSSRLGPSGVDSQRPNCIYNATRDGDGDGDGVGDGAGVGAAAAASSWLAGLGRATPKRPTQKEASMDGR